MHLIIFKSLQQNKHITEERIFRMKKLWIIITMFSLLFLAACGNNDDKDKGTSSKDVKENTQSTETPGEDTAEEKETVPPGDYDESQSKEETSTDQQSNDRASDSNSELTQFKEYPYIKEKVSNINEYKAITETDNPNKRVILYQSNEGKKKYKSIFIKESNRLKLIELDKNGLLYNQVIK